MYTNPSDLSKLNDLTSLDMKNDLTQIFAETVEAVDVDQSYSIDL